MKNISIIDAGPLIALFDKSDSYHQRAKKKVGEYRKKQGKFITSWPMITEAAYMLKEHVCLEAQLNLLEWIAMGGTEIFEVTKEQLPGITEVQKKYADLSMDFADATALLMAQELGIKKIFSVDRKDFSIYFIPGKGRFKNLFFE